MSIMLFHKGMMRLSEPVFRQVGRGIQSGPPAMMRHPTGRGKVFVEYQGGDYMQCIIQFFLK